MSTETSMASASQIAVVGRPDVVVPFRAAGLAVFPVEPGPEAGRRVQELVDGGYSVVFFTEDLFPFLGTLLERARRSATPCLVSLPTSGEQQGAVRLKEVVKRAVGADVFGGAAAQDGKGVR